MWAAIWAWGLAKGTDHFGNRDKDWWTGHNSIYGKWQRVQNVEYMEQRQKSQKWILAALVGTVVWMVNTKWKPR